MTMTIKELMLARSNDYSAVDRAFYQSTGRSLSNVIVHAADLPPLTESVSVVIPSYNGHLTLPVTLTALDRQLYRNFEVIVVDDGSTPALDAIGLGEARSFPLKFVRIPKSGGPGAARNVGVSCAEGNSIVFLDDDIRIANTTLSSLALRQQFTDDLVIVGFREAVGRDQFANDWLSMPRLESDWRRATVDRGMYLLLTADRNVAVPRGRTYRIIEETREFREFGNGRVVGYWDLPHMVVGHSICAKRADIIHAGGFEEKCFNGWGTEDLAFGALMIASRKFVVPALEWVSFHLKHEGRKVSRRTERWQELPSNFEEYLRYINRNVNECAFPAYRFRRVGRTGNAELLEIVDS